MVTPSSIESSHNTMSLNPQDAGILPSFEAHHTMDVNILGRVLGTSRCWYSIILKLMRNL